MERTCRLPAAPPAPVIAAELRDLLSIHGAPMPPAPAADDPHQVLRHAATISRELAHKVEAQLRADEIEAAATARPTPGGHDFIRAWSATGRPLAIVSNNAGPAVEAYLQRHGLKPCVDHVVGRDPVDPYLMKPHPHSLRLACTRLGVRPIQCILVGDSIGDLDAGKVVGVPTIGYANKRAKRRTLATASPRAIVSSIFQLLKACQLS